MIVTLGFPLHKDGAGVARETLTKVSSGEILRAYKTDF